MPHGTNGNRPRLASIGLTLLLLVVAIGPIASPASAKKNRMAGGAAAAERSQLAKSLRGFTAKAANGKRARSTVEPYSPDPSGRRPYAICPPATKTTMSCLAAVVPTKPNNKPAVGPSLEGSGVGGGYAPADIQDAYDLPQLPEWQLGYSERTVAIVVAYDYPNAQGDVDTYREQYGLPPFVQVTKLNQKGEAKNYPQAAETVLGGGGWALEAALDIQMVAASCPYCRVVLVEANSPSIEDLNEAVKSAAKLQPDVITNSWGGIEFAGETGYKWNFDAAIPVLFASGDSGYGASNPASAPDVIAVGGTTLRKSSNKRGYAETGWGGAGSGCSAYQAKPKWQTDSGCAKRSIADVSAVADPASPVSVYYSSPVTPGLNGWYLVGGTSASAPIVAGVEAQSTGAERAKGAQLFWDQGPAGKLFDPADGRNGSCPSAMEYICDGRVGYDGPTGWGSPGGTRPAEPVVGAYDATAVTTDSATIGGAVNPNDRATTYRFEYGTSTAYGAISPPTPGSAGSGTSAVAVSAELSELDRDTVYHYRLVASNSEGTTYSADQTFRTSPWAPQVLPNAVSEYFWGEDVSCSSADACVIPGTKPVPAGEYITYAPAVDRWDGTAWSVEALPSPANPTLGESTQPNGASCSSPSSCMVVGYYIRATGGEAGWRPFSAQWNGTSWTQRAVPLPGDAAPAFNGQYRVELEDVHCLSSSDCVAVGRYWKEKEVGSYTLIERWDGTQWKVQMSANPAGKPDWFDRNTLNAVSCASSSSCVAVGTTGPTLDLTTKPLIERWNGSSWSVESAPSQPGVGNFLRDVSCLSASDCLVVGETYFKEQLEVEPKSYVEVPTAGPLALDWDGEAWSELGQLPAKPLTNVSCMAADSCLAVGPAFTRVLNGAEALVTGGAEYWDGSEWQAQHLVAPADRFPEPEQHLNGISCGARDCMASGLYYGTGGWTAFASRMSGKQPAAVTGAAKIGPGDKATLRGKVTPEGTATTYQFEYGTTPSYGQSAPAAPAPAGSGFKEASVSQVVEGLEANRVYHYRIVASSSEGTSYGRDRTFSLLTPSYKSAFGSQGTGNGQFKVLTDIALDPGDGSLWATDDDNNRVQHLSASGAYIGQFSGCEDPAALTVDGQGNVYEACNSVRKYNAEGELVKTIAAYGTGTGQVRFPTDLTIDDSGNLWVADSENERVLEFSSSGTLLNTVSLGAQGRAWGIDLSPSGEIWVAEPSLHRVTVLDQAGKVLNRFGTEGSGDGQFARPSDIEVDNRGHVWVADAGNGRVQVFDEDGEFLDEFGSQGTGNGQFSTEWWLRLAVGDNGDIWVSDDANHRVQRWFSGGWVLG